MLSIKKSETVNSIGREAQRAGEAVERSTGSTQERTEQSLFRGRQGGRGRAGGYICMVVEVVVRLDYLRRSGGGAGAVEGTVAI